MFNDRLGLLNGLFAPEALDEIERRARELFGNACATPTSGARPPIDVWSSQDEAIVVVELPGIDPAGVEITVEDRVLTLRGTYGAPSSKQGDAQTLSERPRGDFQRAVTLPHRVDAEQTQATYRDGLLEIRLPRANEDRPRRIKVQAKSV